MYLHLFLLKLVVNQPYDETLEVNDDEEVASTFTPSPRPLGGKPGGYAPGRRVFPTHEFL